MNRIRKIIRNLFRPQVVVVTYRRKTVDCGINNEFHTRLAAELSVGNNAQAEYDDGGGPVIAALGE